MASVLLYGGYPEPRSRPMGPPLKPGYDVLSASHHGARSPRKTGMADPRKADETFDEARLRLVCRMGRQGQPDPRLRPTPSRGIAVSRGFAAMSRSAGSSAVGAALLTLSLASGPSRAVAHEHHGQSWHDVKCARYEKAWSAVLARMGSQGLGKEFLDRHEAFLASNCTRTSDVCPRSRAELERANVMVILAMNAGTASTFPPFFCRK